MAATITHLLIGERVFPYFRQFSPVDFGAFLLGCILVDVHVCSAVSRRTTHFSDGLEINGPYSLQRSCTNFLSQLDKLLLRPWDRLSSNEQAFVAGYLCHLAADEEWKRFDRDSVQVLGLRWWADLPMPANIIITAFEMLTSEFYINRAAVTAALTGAVIPNVFNHIPHEVFQATWEIVKAPAIEGSLPETYFVMLERLGKPASEIQSVRQQLSQYQGDALAVIQTRLGGVEPRIQAMLKRSLEVLPCLWV